MENNKNSGFTLIELSIAIVIMGLLIAGILGAASLLQQGKLTKQVSQIREMDLALSTFRSKYNGMPGDSARATRYFGDTAWDGVTDIKNGDGDGIIEGHIDDENAEAAHAMMHLFQAELISQPAVAKSVMRSGLERGGIGIFSEKKRNYYGIGMSYSSYEDTDTVYSDDGTWSDGLTGFEAFSLDEKLDDSLPASGNIRAVEGGYRNISDGLGEATDLTNEECLEKPDGSNIYQYIINEDTSGNVPDCPLRIKVGI